MRFLQSTFEIMWQNNARILISFFPPNLNDYLLIFHKPWRWQWRIQIVVVNKLDYCYFFPFTQRLDYKHFPVFFYHFWLHAFVVSQNKLTFEYIYYARLFFVSDTWWKILFRCAHIQKQNQKCEEVIHFFLPTKWQRWKIVTNVFCLKAENNGISTCGLQVKIIPLLN